MADQIKKLSAGHSIEVLDAIMTEVEEARGEHDNLGERLDEMSSDTPTPSTAAPAMDGTAAAGTSTDYARADHVHQSDTSKQDALTTAQLAAANSGIDSAKVEQIETNKNNILTVANQSTKYNLSPVESGTSSGVGFIVANTNINIPTGDYYFCWTSISNQGGTTINVYKEDDTRIVNFPRPNTVGNVAVAVNVPENGVRFNLYTDVANTLTNIRIIPKTVYDNGFTQYQPYAMSNAELTAAIQALQAQLANQ